MSCEHIIAYDLGTSGNKASLFDSDGQLIAEAFVPYATLYPRKGWHEQRPTDWWSAVVESTQRLLSTGRVSSRNVGCIGISGHSLGVVPVDRQGRLLRETIPIWSDTRATEEADRFFGQVERTQWYRTTGNGFTPACYPIFKMMWYQTHEPGMMRAVHRILGTKDFINLKLTGQMKTDHSYASGSGVYDLSAWRYSSELVEASGIRQEMLPEIVPSTCVLGELTKEAADALGLHRKVRVVCGGVDNSCMALGARNIKDGRACLSLGSSAWIAVSSQRPILGEQVRPYVFAHVIPGMYTSAVSIFSAGSAFRWVRDTVCAETVSKSNEPYEEMTRIAAGAPVGAGGLLFNPSLSGGSTVHLSPEIRGAYVGLDLSHTRADLIRAAMEGIALDLRLALDAFRSLGVRFEEMSIVGGGGRSALWRQILADVFNLSIVKTNIDQQAGSLGAAAVAAVGTGRWENFERIDGVHEIEDITEPIPDHTAVYERLLPVFRLTSDMLAKIGEMLASRSPR